MGRVDRAGDGLRSSFPPRARGRGEPPRTFLAQGMGPVRRGLRAVTAHLEPLRRRAARGGRADAARADPQPHVPAGLGSHPLAPQGNRPVVPRRHGVLHRRSGLALVLAGGSVPLLRRTSLRSGGRPGCLDLEHRLWRRAPRVHLPGSPPRGGGRARPARRDEERAFVRRGLRGNGGRSSVRVPRRIPARAPAAPIDVVQSWVCLSAPRPAPSPPVGGARWRGFPAAAGDPSLPPRAEARFPEGAWPARPRRQARCRSPRRRSR